MAAGCVWVPESASSGQDEAWMWLGRGPEDLAGLEGVAQWLALLLVADKRCVRGHVLGP